MSRYAIISADVVQNVVEADPAYAQAQGWTPDPGNVGPGYSYNSASGAWTPPAAPARHRGPDVLIGAGPPPAEAAAGTFWFRTDTPTVSGQRLYICTASSPAAWAALL